MDAAVLSCGRNGLGPQSARCRWQVKGDGGGDEFQRAEWGKLALIFHLLPFDLLCIKPHRPPPPSTCPPPPPSRASCSTRGHCPSLPHWLEGLTARPDLGAWLDLTSACAPPSKLRTPACKRTPSSKPCLRLSTSTFRTPLLRAVHRRSCHLALRRHGSLVSPGHAVDRPATSSRSGRSCTSAPPSRLRDMPPASPSDTAAA